MSLDKDQAYSLQKLIEQKKQILDSVSNIESILRTSFPQEFDIAYQHWIPQIITALQENSRWLKRGQYNLDDTINSILDRNTDNEKIGQTVKKYIEK